MKNVAMLNWVAHGINELLPDTFVRRNGQHSCITELLRNGASLVEAKELACHRDVRMTMKYNQIGLEDQTKALSKIGWE